jgi:maleate isomerase
VIRIGVITPHATPGPEVEFAAMAGPGVITRIAHVTGGAGAGNGDPTSPTSLLDLTGPPYLESAVERLRAELVDVVGYASTTSAYVIGADGEQAVLTRSSRLIGRPIASTGSAAVHALNALGVARVALVGAPWFTPEFNDLGIDYFSSQGFDVVSSVSAQLPHDPDLIDPAAVVSWASRHVEDAAEAVFLGGNGFRTAAAIKQLEAAIDRPVLTANQVLLWQLLALAQADLDIDGYGRLFACRP